MSEQEQPVSHNYRITTHRVQTGILRKRWQWEARAFPAVGVPPIIPPIIEWGVTREDAIRAVKYEIDCREEAIRDAEESEVFYRYNPDNRSGPAPGGRIDVFPMVDMTPEESEPLLPIPPPRQPDPTLRGYLEDGPPEETP
jgi:hypothetical protein